MDNRMDDRIEEIRKKIGVCDDIIIKQLVDLYGMHSGDHCL